MIYWEISIIYMKTIKSLEINVLNFKRSIEQEENKKKESKLLVI
jgi:hypothetical protein